MNSNLFVHSLAALLAAVILGCSANGGMKVLSLNKVTGQSVGEDQSFVDETRLVCSHWELGASDVVDILSHADTINHFQYWEACYLPCKYVGDVSVQGRVWGFMINAAGGVYLNSGDSTVYLWSNRGDLQKYFVDSLHGQNLAEPCSGTR